MYAFINTLALALFSDLCKGKCFVVDIIYFLNELHDYLTFSNLRLKQISLHFITKLSRLQTDLFSPPEPLTLMSGVGLSLQASAFSSSPVYPHSA